jgi:Ca2+-binding EF-hand superfamily protein
MAMLRIVSACCTALLALTALPAFAEEAAKGHDPRAAFAETDENADNRVDREEFHHRMVEIFFHGDRDKDGYMTSEELAGAVEFPKDFANADRDADSRISLYEFIQVRFSTFDEVDTNTDGVLTVEEVVEAFEGKR